MKKYRNLFVGLGSLAFAYLIAYLSDTTLTMGDFGQALFFLGVGVCLFGIGMAALLIFVIDDLSKL